MQDKLQSNRAINVENLNCQYGDKSILASIFFEVYQHQVFVMLGPGGSGKSTILKYLHRSCGSDLEYSYDKLEMVGRVSYLGQHDVFLENTFEEHFNNAKLDIEKELNKHWKSKWLIHKLSSYRNTLKTEIPKSSFKLLQFSFFLSQSSDSEILLLDEPEVNLHESMVFLVNKIEELKKEKTIIIVTHNIAFTKKVADQIFYLSYGNSIENLPTKEFLNSKNPDVQYILKMGC